MDLNICVAALFFADFAAGCCLFMFVGKCPGKRCWKIPGKGLQNRYNRKRSRKYRCGVASDHLRPWEIKGRFRNLGWFWRMHPRSGFHPGGTSERTLVPVFVPGEHPNAPSFRFSFRGNIPGKSHPWTNTSVGGNFGRTFGTIGPYEFPQEKVWTNDWSM